VSDELLKEIRALRGELRQLRGGELVARLTEAERHAIAQQVLDGLDERYAAQQLAAHGGKRGAGERPYFES
jgi:hypothetical protein